ncbi:MAG TPA: PsbP-related protein [Candidatus Paceibacterota bacterium]|nr:PsbP-related protein [Candidatus Paceibacterota bacterium]
MEYISRSALYLLIAVGFGILAAGVDVYAVIATQSELTLAITDEIGPVVHAAKGVNIKNEVVYRNEEYGFSFQLPESWKGYSIVPGTREIRDVASGTVVATAPTIAIRHPAWTTAAPRQDIPIDIYTLAQWDKIVSEEYSVSAAPIPPSELGRNDQYVFALPARYNFAYQTGWEEVQKIMDGKPLATFSLSDMSGWQTYRNEEYGFEIKYPADWKENKATIASFSGQATLLAGAHMMEKSYTMWPGEFDVQVYADDKNLSLDEWINENQPRDPSGGTLVRSIKNASLAGIAAKELMIFGFDHTRRVIIAPKGGRVYYLEMETGENPNDPKLEKHEAEVELILSTFKFMK